MTSGSDGVRTFKLLLAVFFLGGWIASGESFGATASDKTQSVSGGGVTTKATYLAQTAHESRFSIVLDTHSVNLDSYDLKALSVLRDDTGMTSPPTGAENKGSGHHREIILTFPRPSKDRKWLELVIKDVAGVKERIFRWNEK